MNNILRPAFAILALLACTSAGAQTYNCEGADGKVTYGDKPCAPGKKDEGKVPDHLSTTPAPKKRQAASPPPADKADKPQAKRAAAKPAPQPERRCFTVKTATGTATRCNDDPGKPDP